MGQGPAGHSAPPRGLDRLHLDGGAHPRPAEGPRRLREAPLAASSTASGLVDDGSTRGYRSRIPLVAVDAVRVLPSRRQRRRWRVARHLLHQQQEEASVLAASRRTAGEGRGKSDYPEITRVAARLAEVSISAAREYMNELKSSAGPYELVGQGRERKLQKRLQRAS